MTRDASDLFAACVPAVVVLVMIGIAGAVLVGLLIEWSLTTLVFGPFFAAALIFAAFMGREVLDDLRSYPLAKCGETP